MTSERIKDSISIMLLILALFSTFAVYLSAIQAQITEKTTITVIEKIVMLRDFENITELRDFLERDQTNKYREEGMTCFNYSTMLIRAAEKEGYRLMFLWEHTDLRNHALCMAYLREKRMYVVIEPTCDKIKWLWNTTTVVRP